MEWVLVEIVLALKLIGIPIESSIPFQKVTIEILT
jgi:hypothetical protein